METKNASQNRQRNQTPTNVLDVANLRAQRSLLTARIVGTRGEERRKLVRRMRPSELLAFVANDGVNRAVRIAVISMLEDAGLLVAIAEGAAPTFIKSNALRRLDEMCEHKGCPLTPAQTKRLTPCLNDKDLIAFTVVLMDACDFDWCAYCDASTVSALCAAMYETDSIHESVILEDAYAQLVHSRPDLQAGLSACNPASYLMNSLRIPASPQSKAFDNVA